MAYEYLHNQQDDLTRRLASQILWREAKAAQPAPGLSGSAFCCSSSTSSCSVFEATSVEVDASVNAFFPSLASIPRRPLTSSPVPSAAKSN
ncbi:hypothetical protein PsorP6_000544 [Peronosclerospora sorghi]|uniref:Uncharacterized protein n=1 Tax=Peronosclerospora sorghi TaxID=230839 RepID=A0ACC0WUW3_9STRA|nr:hypothetical protein PsorP6_000544 [Peronosclerospora sorghi]